MEVYEEAELLLLGARQCDRCGRPDTDVGQFLVAPSAWYCSKCTPLIEARARVWGRCWQADDYYYYCTEFPQHTGFDEGEFHWYERMDAIRLVWLDEYWTDED
jgi:hypothetical protein